MRYTARRAPGAAALSCGEVAARPSSTVPPTTMPGSEEASQKPMPEELHLSCRKETEMTQIGPRGQPEQPERKVPDEAAAQLALASTRAGAEDAPPGQTLADAKTHRHAPRAPAGPAELVATRDHPDQPKQHRQIDARQPGAGLTRTSPVRKRSSSSRQRSACGATTYANYLAVWQSSARQGPRLTVPPSHTQRAEAGGTSSTRLRRVPAAP